MAFPLPSHLPRRKDQQDVSTKILTKISETTVKSLTSELAVSWVAELEQTIAHTKGRIRERVQTDLPSFEQQLSSARTIQERLQTLTQNVDQLSGQLSHPESGIVPVLLTTLTRHATLAQDSLDAEVASNAISHLQRCRDGFEEFSQLVRDGRLPEAGAACINLEAILESSPDPLPQTSIMSDVKRNYAAMKARMEEQLTDAYMRSVSISTLELIVRPSVQVRQSETILPLSAVLSSLTPGALASHLATLRRDIIHHVNHILNQPTSISVSSASDLSGITEHRLSLTPSPPNSPDLPSRLANLSLVLSFLDDNLLPQLPLTERHQFLLSLCKPLTAAVLNLLLIPFLPSAASLLPRFLELVQQARQFETEYIGSMLGDSGTEQDIRTWADGVSQHYERKRREELLQHGRLIVVGPEDESRIFYIDLQIVSDVEEKVPDLPAQADPEPIEENADAAWNFDDDLPSGNPPAPVPKTEGMAAEDNADENGWGFDDEIEPEPEPEPEPNPESTPVSHVDSASAETTAGNNAAYAEGDAWGWNDDDDSETLNDDDNPWDDPWNEQPAAEEAPKSKPKPARGLEKLSSKRKADLYSPPVQSPVPVVPPPPTPMMPSTVSQTKHAIPLPIQTKAAPVIETYMVSGRARDLIQHVHSVLTEGAELASSSVFSAHSVPSTSLGAVLSQAAPLTLELFRAVYPVTFSSAISESPKRSMRFSNDCLYLSAELDRMLRSLDPALSSVKSRLEESCDRFKILSESWFEESINRQCQLVNEILDGAEGFVDTTDQDRYDDCENAVNRTLQRVRNVAQQWKAVLNKSKYYDAIGAVVDAALSRIMADILALPDITAEESHRLSELCRILNALEGLFVENPERPSFVVAYVPSWLKYSYLSELLEASIADISYLFEEGALIDFEIEELVKLVQALFADTPLRATTINKLLRGHPAQQ